MYRRKKSPYRKILPLILVVGAVIFGGIRLYRHYFDFNAEKILKDSILSEKTFDKQAVEVVSPQYGIKAYLLEDKTNPIISLSFMFKGQGLAADDEKQYGISLLASSLLTDGAGDLDSAAFKEKLENLAIGMSFSAGMDDFSGSVVTTVQNQQEAWQMLQDVLMRPRFEGKDVKRLKSQMENAFLRQKEHPASKLSLEFAKFLFGNHPYGRNPLGNLERIKGLNRNDLQTYLKNRLTRNNLIIGVAGDISPQALGHVLDKVFGSLPEKGQNVFVRNTDIKFDGRRKNIKSQTGQNISSFAVQGVARNHPDFYPLYIANHIFGGAGLNSRLSMAAREQEGLTYSIYTYLSLADKAPLLRGGFSSTPDNYPRVWEIINAEWKRFGTDGATEQEVNDAKRYLLASYNLRFASIDNLSDILMYMQKENLGLDFLQKRNENIKKVTTDDINAAARKYFAANGMVSANIGSFKNN